MGALILAHSLKESGTQKLISVMITSQVSSSTRERLAEVFDRIHLVEERDSNDTAHLALLGRPELGVTLTKIYAWKLTEYTKAVFLDADTLVVQNVDELFERPEFSAAPDVGWPDCFNSGVFVFVPSNDTFERLVEHARTVGSFDGGDQGLLNTFFSNWSTSGPEHRLSFLYNMNANQSYSYLPAFKMYGHLVKIIHFIGSYKPWHWPRNVTGIVFAQPDSPSHSTFHVQLWWNVFDRHYSTSSPPLSLNIAPYGQTRSFAGITERVTPSYITHSSDSGYQQHTPYRRPFDFSIIQRKLDSLITDKFGNTSPSSSSSNISGSTSSTSSTSSFSSSAHSASVSQTVESLESFEKKVAYIQSKIEEIKPSVEKGNINPRLMKDIIDDVGEHLHVVEHTFDVISGKGKK